MRKIFAVVLVLTIAVVFAACGDSKDESTTLDPLYTAYSPVATNAQNSGQNGGTGATYVLTTNQGKTAPALSTTRFSIAVAATASTQSTAASTDYNTTASTGVITTPVVSTTRTITTTWATIATTTTTTTTQTTTKQLTTNSTTKATTTTQPTTKAEPEAVYVDVAYTSTDDNGRIYVAIESDGWGGKLKSNSQRVTVYVDGVAMEQQVMLQISSATDGDGKQSVYLDMDDYDVDIDSSTITFEIPEGFLENKTGTKYNYAYEVTM